MNTSAVTDPRHVSARRLLELGSYDEAIQLLDSILRESPNDTNVLNDTAVAYQHRGETLKAEKYLRHALEIRPDHEPAFYNLLDVLNSSYKYISACELFKTYGPDLPSSREKIWYSKQLGIELPNPEEYSASDARNDLKARALRVSQVSLDTKNRFVERIYQRIKRIESLNDLTDEPLVSVCVLAYNHEDFIVEAIEGVLAQKTDYAFEVIIVDDKSTDRTRQILLDFQRKYPNKIRVLLAEHNLYSINRHLPAIAALSAVRGKYVALCEGDDYWIDESKLQKQTDLMEANPDCAVSFASVMFKYENSQRDSFAWPTLNRFEYTLSDILGQYFIPTCSAVLRSDLVSSVPGWLIREARDTWWPLYVSAAMQGTVIYIDEIFGVRRKHEGGVYSGLDRVAQIMHDISNLEVYYREFPPERDTIRPRLVNQYAKLLLAGDHSKRPLLYKWAKLRYDLIQD